MTLDERREAFERAVLDGIPGVPSDLTRGAAQLATYINDRVELAWLGFDRAACLWGRK
jgi:hypothetical protein